MSGGKHRRAAPTPFEWAFLVLCAALLAWQLLLPGFIGMADNGDFPRMAGRLCLAGVDHDTDKFDYFQPEYARTPAPCYNPRIPSSEIVPVWLAVKLERTVGDKRRFDIRWLGALHALIFLGVYYLMLLLLRPLHVAARIVLSLAALWIFVDASVTAYWNSFYTDVPAMLGGLAAIVLAVLLASGEREGWPWVGLFGLAALFFLTAKTQHAICAPVPLAAAAWFGWRSRAARTRITAGVVCGVLIAGAAFLFAGTPAWYTAESRFSLIFTKIAAASRSPARDLVELGLDAGDTRYAGMHAFTPGNPSLNPEWNKRFCAQTSSAAILKFHLRHPAMALAFLLSDLRIEAKSRRIFGNFPRSYGRPPGARTERLASWSDLRSWLFRVWPWHIVVWYALAILVGPVLAWRARSRYGRALLAVVAAVALMGLVEFCISSLADATETNRHLWMFQVLTDATLFLALVYAASRVAGPLKSPSQAGVSGVGMVPLVK